MASVLNTIPLLHLNQITGKFKSTAYLYYKDKTKGNKAAVMNRVC